MRWVAEVSGLPWLEERPDGGIDANEAARPFVAGAQNLEEALSRLGGFPSNDTRVVALLDTLDREGRASAELGHFRVVLAGPRAGAVALFVPPAVAEASDVHRRAAATDLSAAVSHELSNVLGAILGWASLARRRGDVDARLDRALSLIESSARNAHATARSLLDSARGRVVGNHEPVDLGELVAEIVEVLEPKAAQRGVRIERSLPDNLWVRGNRGQLFTAVWNLVQNGIEATPENGAVRVQGSIEAAGILLAIEDDGPGVPEAHRTRIFDPYFTTKESGTGLGLALVRRSIDELEGTLALESTTRGGARFVIMLPAATKRRPRKQSQPRRASGVLERGDPRGKRILVVDDDTPMRDLLATALGLAGANVVTAANAADAMAVEGTFDLALVDLGLGDLRGDRLLAELRRRGTVTRAALVSGASIPPGMTAGAEPDVWLRKPFEIDDLLTAVRHLLAGDAADDGAATSR